MSQLTPLTLAGEVKLRAELKHLKYTVRPEIVDAIATARAHGDLKENAEYHAAREQQSFNEGRIKLVEGTVSNSQIIDVSQTNVGDKIVFGATVTLFDLSTEEEVTYQIVGDIEADIKQKLISVNSPIARAMIGKSTDDEFEFKAPNGKKEYEVVAVVYK